MKIGTHEFESTGKPLCAGEPHQEEYYKCKECGLVIFKGIHTGKYIISNISDKFMWSPEETTCSDWIIREVIK